MVPFYKMDGAKNYFVIVDARKENITFSKEQIINLSSNKNKITKGCDQFIVMRESNVADVFMEIYNKDGSRGAACGNATRCVAWFLAKELKQNNVNVATDVGILYAEASVEKKYVLVNMGKPKFFWQDIPILEDKETLDFSNLHNQLQQGFVVNVGNPHIVFFIKGLKKFPISKVAPIIQKNQIFSEGVNVGFAEVINDKEISLRVYERGSGETLACGTGACAAGVSAIKHCGLNDSLKIHLPGGDIDISWKDDVMMGGEVKYYFKSNLNN